MQAKVIGEFEHHIVVEVDGLGGRKIQLSRPSNGRVGAASYVHVFPLKKEGLSPSEPAFVELDDVLVERIRNHPNF